MEGFGWTDCLVPGCCFWKFVWAVLEVARLFVLAIRHHWQCSFDSLFGRFCCSTYSLCLSELCAVFLGEGRVSR